MKTNFTSHAFRFLSLTCVLAYFSLSLSGQTTHNIAVTNNAFTPSDLTITLGDKVVWTNNAGSHNVNGTKATFASNPEGFGNNVGSGWTYEHVFNTVGTYDYQCDPHASMGMVGKVIVNPKPSTGPYSLTINFTGMTPHVGQTLWLAVIDKATKTEVGRVKKIVEVSFSIVVSGIEIGKSYNVDFYSDHNKNGIYDVAPTDHTWRMELNNVTGNSVLNFAHNTTFTDIAWKNKLTVHFTGMTPHLNQKITLFLKQSDTGLYKDTVIVPSVTAATFDISSWKIKPGLSYKIDFYADHNKNGTYDAPPIDHAWRISLDKVVSDTIVNFAHNTTFTDILPVATNSVISDKSGILRLYPNPASQYVELTIPENYKALNSLKVYNITGSLVEFRNYSENSESIRYDVSQLKNGIYFMEVTTGNQRSVLKFIKD